jgi:ceramide glucosyltransferase
MSEFGVALLSLAFIGTASSSIFLVLALAGAVKFGKQAREQRRNEQRVTNAGYPPVSILKPLHGMEPELERNLESFFLQDYPDFEILFAVDTQEDAALPVAQKLCLKYPEIRSQIIVTGEPPWPNPPAYSFARMAAAARHDVLATSDSDVEVDRDYLKSVVAPLAASQTGMVTCVYRGLNTGGFWSALDAVGMSVEMTAGVLVANLLEGIKFGLGPTIVVRRDALEAIGGYRALGEYFSNDFMIGNLVAARGFTVALSRHIISHVVPPMTFKRMWQRQVRWATGTKHSRAKGHFGTVFVFAVPYGLLGLAAGLLLHRPGLGLTLLALSIVNRLVEALAIGWGVTRDRECLRKPWLYLVRDLLGFAVWVASYLSRNMRWRDGRFELVEGGRILVRDRNGNLVRLSDALAAGDESAGD